MLICTKNIMKCPLLSSCKIPENTLKKKRINNAIYRFWLSCQQLYHRSDILQDNHHPRLLNNGTLYQDMIRSETSNKSRRMILKCFIKSMSFIFDVLYLFVIHMFYQLPIPTLNKLMCWYGQLGLYTCITFSKQSTLNIWGFICCPTYLFIL